MNLCNHLSRTKGPWSRRCSHFHAHGSLSPRSRSKLRSFFGRQSSCYSPGGSCEKCMLPHAPVCVWGDGEISSTWTHFFPTAMFFRLPINEAKARGVKKQDPQVREAGENLFRLGGSMFWFPSCLGFRKRWAGSMLPETTSREQAGYQRTGTQVYVEG